MTIVRSTMLLLATFLPAAGSASFAKAQDRAGQEGFDQAVQELWQAMGQMQSRSSNRQAGLGYSYRRGPDGSVTVEVTTATYQLQWQQDSGGLTVQWTRQFTLADADHLQDEFPEIYMHMAGFPQSIGDADIELAIKVTRTYQAANDEDLKERYPEVHALLDHHQRHVQQLDEHAWSPMREIRQFPVRRIPQRIDGEQIVPPAAEEAPTPQRSNRPVRFL